MVTLLIPLFPGLPDKDDRNPAHRNRTGRWRTNPLTRSPLKPRSGYPGTPVWIRTENPLMDKAAIRVN
jgi:hypothetical protein